MIGPKIKIKWEKQNNSYKCMGSGCIQTRNNPPWRSEGAYLTKRFIKVHQQEQLVRAMLLRSIRTNRSYSVLSQELDSILKFLVTLAFPS